MPQLIRNIDEIARDKKRDVLFLRFGDGFDFERLPIRRKIMSWLDENAIPYERCVACPSNIEVLSYFGEIYLDVPFDKRNAQYLKLLEYLEDGQGVMKHKKVGFYVWPYKLP